MKLLDSMYSPVVIFCYNRLEAVKKTIHFLSRNIGADKTDVFIFSDGPKNVSDKNIVDDVRNYLHTVSGFKSVTILETEVNKGLARSIIDGVSEVLSNHESVIVLEDDLLTSQNFLPYMMQCLEAYKNNQQVFSISGYTPPTIKKGNTYLYDVFFFPRNSSHGWATWKDRWEKVDWEVNDFDDFITNKDSIKRFNYGGSDLTSMLKRQMEGKINSWSIRFCYHQFRTNTLTVYPVISKIQNIGFGLGATHTNNYNRFHSELDYGTKTIFNLPEKVFLKEEFNCQFQSIHSVKARVIGKFKTYLYKADLIKNR